MREMVMERCKSGLVRSGLELISISPLLSSHSQSGCVLSRLVHLDVKETSEELLRQLSYAIKNQLVASKAPY